MKKATMLLAAASIAILLLIVHAKAQTISSASVSLQEQNTMSVLWFQKSGEAKALYYQGYNIGKMRLDEILRNGKKNKGKKPAIVLDIDETVLDNSPYHAWMVQTGKGNPMAWSEWFDRAAAKPVPGALEFLRYADKKGVAIYYISNRLETQMAATMKNLKDVGAPQVINSHVLLLRKNEIGKERRRLQVAKTHDIVLLFGDNLGDFNGFDELSAIGRIQAAERKKAEFGKKLIVFPNPMYGDWESAIYRYDFDKSKEELAKLRKDNLQPYQP